MKYLKAYIFTGAVLGFAFAPGQVNAYDYNFAAYLDAHRYLEYELREPCQFYRPIPRGIAPYDRCKDRHTPMKEVTTRFELLPVVASYTIYFDFDKSNVRKDQIAVIDKLASELDFYKPAQVTVVGHADASGDADYNKALSAKRADAVTHQLNLRHISSFYLDEEARGEEDLAVPTPDGMRLQENRRVVVQFRK